MRCRVILFVMACSILISIAYTKPDKFPVLKGHYLGQKPPGRQRTIFAPGIVSTGYNEHGVSFTPDGKEVFYRLMGPPHGVVLTMREEKEGWTAKLGKICPVFGPQKQRKDFPTLHRIVSFL